MEPCYSGCNEVYQALTILWVLMIMEPCHSGCKEVYQAWPSCGHGKYGALPFWMQGGLSSLAIMWAMGNMEPCHSGCKEVYRAWPSCGQWEIWSPAILDERRFIELGHPMGNGKYGALLFLIHGGLSSFGHPVGNGKYEALPFWMQGGL